MGKFELYVEMETRCFMFLFSFWTFVFRLPCVCFLGVLVGNKSDLSARREVQTSVAQEWAQSQELEYHETSAVSVVENTQNTFCCQYCEF